MDTVADRDQTMIENVIGLFAEENLAEMADADAAAEASDTVEIGTAEELVAFAKSVTDGSKGGYAGQTVVLTADIDCTDVEWTPIGTMEHCTAKGRIIAEGNEPVGLGGIAGGAWR